MKQFRIRTISKFEDVAHVIELRVNKSITQEGDKITSYHVWRDRNTEYQDFRRFDTLEDAQWQYLHFINEEFENNNVVP